MGHPGTVEDRLPGTNPARLNGVKAGALARDEIVMLRLEECRKAHSVGWLLTPLNGKRPILLGWTTAPAPSLQEIEKFALNGNVGIRTGLVSGIVVIDDDTEHGTAAKELDLPPTPTVITGSGQLHHYFVCPPEGLSNSVSLLAKNVDVRGDGGQVVSVGSIHPDTGRPYLWKAGCSPDEIQLAILPDRILRTLTQRLRPSPRASATDFRGSGSALEESHRRIASAGEGCRNTTLNSESFRIGQLIQFGLIEEGLARETLLAAGESSGLPAWEVKNTVESGLGAGVRNPRTQPSPNTEFSGNGNPREAGSFRKLTDTGNAERLVAQRGNDLHFVGAWHKWLVWDKTRWSIEQEECVLGMTKNVVRSIYAEASESNDLEERKRIGKWAHQSEQLTRRRAMTVLTRSEQGIPIDHRRLDLKPTLLNCPNGTLDLKTGLMREHNRGDLLSKLCPVQFTPEATCPAWESFLSHVLPDRDLREFVQKAVGWSLTGDTSEQVLFFCLGSGANGKSTFLHVLLELLGFDYSIQAAPELLLGERNRAHPTELADLFGIRIAVCTELGQKRSFDEVQLKQLTGGDRIRARRMREDLWEFDPTHHIWIAANHKPLVSGTDEAFWRRILMIPFDVTVPKGQRDKNLPGALRKELPGILAWAVRGCVEWYAMGLEPPSSVLTATRGYRDEMDHVGRFLAERCVEVDSSFVHASELYSSYTDWCQSAGEELQGQRAFGQSLGERNYTRRKRRGLMTYRGIKLADRVDSGEDGEQDPVSNNRTNPQNTEVELNSPHSPSS